MPVTIKKKSLTIVSLLTRLFDASTLQGSGILHKADVLEQSGYQLKCGIKTFSIIADTGKEFVTVSQVPLKLETVQLAMKKKLGITVKTIVKDKVVDLIKVAFFKMMDVQLSEMVKPKLPKPEAFTISPEDAKGEVMEVWGVTKNKVSMIKKLRALTGLSLKESKDMCEKWLGALTPKFVWGGDFITVGKGVDIGGGDITVSTETPGGILWGIDWANTKDTPVLLKDATKLHQPVCGTNGGSVYNVIAISPSVIVAARIRMNNEVAIRAELLVHPASKKGQTAKVALLNAGLEKKDGGHYSLHLEPDDFNMVKRSVGSTLFATGLQFNAVSADLKAIQGAGI